MLIEQTGQTGQKTTYGYDTLGRRIATTDPRTGTSITHYNTKGQVDWVEDAANNRTIFAYEESTGRRISTTDALSNSVYTAYSVEGQVAVAHDDDGNMIQAPLSSFGGSLLASTLGWNGENRMITASNSAMTARYAYDYMGRRIQKVVAGVGGPGSTVTNTFLYDGWNLIREMGGTASSPSVTHYIWGLDLSGSIQGAGGIGGLLCVIENGVPYYPQTDANGNITSYVDGNGALVARREFDPFGNTIVATGGKVNDFRFWFSSKYLDSETGLYYYGYRYLSTELRRWVSRDPIGEKGGLNVYHAVNNSMIVSIDKLGLVRFVGCDESQKRMLEGPIRYWRHLQNPSWFPASSGNHEGFCKCLLKKKI